MSRPDQHRQRDTRRRRRPPPLWAAGLAAAVFLIVAAGAGCRPRETVYVASSPAPAMIPQEQGDDYWRARYQANRPEAPEQYQVFPKQPRDNAFGEFNDRMHQGLDAQPELPALPADSFPRPPARFAPPDGGNRAAPAPVSMGGRTAPASFEAAHKPAGIDTGNHFYPVEQLVYGGDYPDIDKPELYRLMPRDVITVTVKDHPEFSGRLEIQADGTVVVPNAPDIVRLRGMSVEEAAEALRATLAVYVKGECKVRVQANRARGGYYFVFGDVLQPGRFPMGLEPVKLSDAVLAANWEANPARRDMDGDDMGPSFPAASPRGKFVSPPTADLAGVLLITPHRSQPVRTRHDVRSAFLGMTGDDPLVRPGQIVVVPSLDPARNRNLGLAAAPGTAAPVPALVPGRGFATANTPARLPETVPAGNAATSVPPYPATVVDGNMTAAFDANINTSASAIREGVTID